MSDAASVLTTLPWFAWIAIIAIIASTSTGAVTKLVELNHRHRERMAMIRSGIHPDHPDGSAVADRNHAYAKGPVQPEV